MPSLILNQQSSKRQSGFTLLELVLVMLIIGLVASTPLVFIDNQDNQLRYDETLDKMELLRKSILMQSSYRNQPVLSGFVIDNGVLPPASAASPQVAEMLQPLINKNDWPEDGGDDWLNYGMHSPYTVLGPSSTAERSAYPQLKGYRGNYLSSGLDSNQEFLDGWGIPFAVSNASNTYQFNYQGDEDHPAPYDIVISGEVKADDWQVRLNQIDILVDDKSGNNLILALVIFKNQSAGSPANPANRWVTYHFDVPVSSATHSLSLGSGEWSENGEPVSDASNEFVPAGQHAVFVLNSAGNTVLKYDRLLVIPGATQPALQFEVN
ncbi:type II secretion system protein [Neptuniibacter sp. QD34_54]|uniref:type II secretion system protein n=1 Tax=unclassified Neptuniibacter TaxID=2630693 RepID=UPI0039F68DA9